MLHSSGVRLTTATSSFEVDWTVREPLVTPSVSESELCVMV